MTSHLLVGNPTAQSGKAAGYLERALDGLRERGVEARLLPTEPAGRTVGLVTRAVEAERPDVVVYLGGDGTFNEVARGLLAASVDVPLGMLPMGTANNQGRSLGVRWLGLDKADRTLDVKLTLPAKIGSAANRCTSFGLGKRPRKAWKVRGRR